MIAANLAAKANTEANNIPGIDAQTDEAAY